MQHERESSDNWTTSVGVQLTVTKKVKRLRNHHHTISRTTQRHPHGSWIAWAEHDDMNPILSANLGYLQKSRYAALYYWMDGWLSTS